MKVQILRKQILFLLILPICFFIQIGTIYAKDGAVSKSGDNALNLNQEAAHEAVQKIFQTYNAPQAGDPVLITTGRYIFQETDISIPGSIFHISRQHVTENNEVGSIGGGWVISLDSRIIRGRSFINESVIQQLEESAEKVHKNWENIDKSYESTQKIADQVWEIYEKIKGDADELKAIQDRGNYLQSLNRYTSFAGSPSFYEEVGNENIVLVDENGAPFVYHYESGGVWLSKQSRRLESVDGNGADTKAGFIEYRRGEDQWYYNGDGILIGVKSLAGKYTRIYRDENQKIIKIIGPHNTEYETAYTDGRISMIVGPEDTVLHYGYDDIILSSVTDIEGDTIKYTYEDGRLKQIVKPDDSFIEIQYGYDGSGGQKLVSSIRNEEGFEEKFLYFPSQKMAVYTNQSGVKTEYWYDDNHRTTEERYGDGSVKKYQYNESNRIEIINGYEVKYLYDNRGNVREKIYGNGSMESWIYNQNDQPLQYTNRDGVITKWVYERSNHFAENQNGIHVTPSYEYNENGYVSKRSITVNGETISEQWEYDGLGRITKYIDGIGREWTYAYTKKITTEQNPFGLLRVYTYNNRKDLISILEKDIMTGEVRETVMTYDKRHLMLYKADGAGNITEYAYREDGKMIEKRQEDSKWEYLYDEGGRLSQMTHSKNGESEIYIEKYTYQFLNDGREERIVTVNGTETTKYVYNANGFAESIENPLGEVSYRTISPDGKLIMEQEVDGIKFTYQYDNLGRLIAIRRDNETTAEVKLNINGSIAEMRDHQGNIRTYEYDERGLVKKEVTELAEKRYIYDKVSRLIYMEIENLQDGTVYTTEWIYAEDNRQIHVIENGKPITEWEMNAWGEYTEKRNKAAVFTIVDPLKEVNKWFLSVNNNPVNYERSWIPVN